MTSVDDIGRLFKAACDGHANVAGTPSEDDVISFKEDLLNMCLQIAF